MQGDDRSSDERRKDDERRQSGGEADNHKKEMEDRLREREKERHKSTRKEVEQPGKERRDNEWEFHGLQSAMTANNRRSLVGGVHVL